MVILVMGGRLATALPVAFQVGEDGREGAIQIAWIDLISLYTPTCLMSSYHCLFSHSGKSFCRVYFLVTYEVPPDMNMVKKASTDRVKRSKRPMTKKVFTIRLDSDARYR